MPRKRRALSLCKLVTNASWSSPLCFQPVGKARLALSVAGGGATVRRSGRPASRNLPKAHEKASSHASRVLHWWLQQVAECAG